MAEKTLSGCLGKPTLIALSQTIEGNRKVYYDAIERMFHEGLDGFSGIFLPFSKQI